MRNKISSILLVVLLAITFYFKGDTLYWGEKDKSSVNYLKLQLDKNDPPNVNSEPIKKIKKIGSYEELLRIETKDKYWILHYSGPEISWWIEDWREI